MKENKYIDLSLLLTEYTPVFPGEPNIIFKQYVSDSLKDLFYFKK